MIAALDLQDIDQTKFTLVGGKAANLGELSRMPGIHVPPGFCITTDVFKKTVLQFSSINGWLEQLSHVGIEERDKIATYSGEIRRIIEHMVIPQNIRKEITRRLSGYGANNAYAVRSSATAEDLPYASFAGQQDTWLNIVGEGAVLQHISKCWASLFTDRAVTYRIKNGFDHSQVYISVIVQRMVIPQASGVAFTADPITSNRKLLSIDAGFGLGENLVAGLVTPDHYIVQGEHIAGKTIATKKGQALTNGQILQLARIGRQIEAHFGCPQDIEWCLAGDIFYIVQARPITTLYPVPVANDQNDHVYVSVGHQQMMTDPIKPLGLSLFQLTAVRPMYIAGGRLFVDVTANLASPAGREALLGTLGRSDPLIKDALLTIIERKDLISASPNAQPAAIPGSQTQIGNDPAIVADLIRNSQTSIAALKENIRYQSGTDLFDFIQEDLQQLKTILFDPRSLAVIFAAINTAAWINEKMMLWLGEKNAADALSQSVANNITSEMGLALLDVADVIRPYPAVIDYLMHVKDDSFLDGLHKLDGGQETGHAIRAFLDKYGMRCVGEIDITRARWSERPATIIPIIISNIRNHQTNAGKQRFEQGQRQAEKKKQQLLERLKQLPDGEHKAKETEQKISLLRNLAGYREYPKYSKINRYFVYKQAILKETGKLVHANIIPAIEDIYYLTFEELREVVRTQTIDHRIVAKRKDRYKLYEKLTPPRVITSDGEIITGKYKREDGPSGAIIGLPVSAGVVEGRARVIMNIEDADLEEGDILVTAFTDPSWTPLFVSIKGLVTEVGGLMTHGSVIAREYGLPAVVGVENATQLIKDGQQIRVHGTEGYIEILQ